MDLFGFEAPARPAPRARQPVAPPAPPVTLATLPAATAPVSPLAVETPPFGEDLPPRAAPIRPMMEPSLRYCSDIEDVTDSATLSLAHMFQGWRLLPPGEVYVGMTNHQAIRWAVAALEQDGWLRDAAQPGTPSRFILDVHPAVNCGLEVYQLLTQMLAAILAGQVVSADPIDAAGLRRWAGHAERVLYNHRRAALARKEPHA